jgi:hypothetical protein
MHANVRVPSCCATCARRCRRACALTIPDANAADDLAYAFFDQVALPSYSTDPWVLAFEPYDWQADTELGTPGVDTKAIDDLLTVDFSKIDELPSIDAMPVFDPAAMADVSQWLSTSGEGQLFVYGQDDPWSAGAFDVTGAKDTLELVVAGGNHGAEIAGLAPADQKAALEALSRWANVPIAPPPPRARPRPPLPPMRVRARRH